MATTVQFRRANTANTLVTTGSVGEITIDTDKKTVVVHDGSTAGGFPLMREDATFESITSITFGSNLTINTSIIDIGNSTANITANSVLIKVANSTSTANLEPSQLVVGTSKVNSTAIASGSNLTIDTVNLFIGNTTANLTANSILVSVANSTSTANVSPLGVSVGTVVVNSALVTTPSANITSNTGLNLGTSSATANGFTYLPNGIIMQWGAASANSTESTIAFANTFTNLWSLVLTPESSTYDVTYVPIVLTSNTSAANVATANDTSITVRYTAIGN